MSTQNGAATIPTATANRGATIQHVGTSTTKKRRTYSAIFAQLPGKPTGLKVTLPTDSIRNETLTVSCPVGVELTEEYDNDEIAGTISDCENVGVAFARTLASGAKLSNTKSPDGATVAEIVREYL